MPEVKWSAVIFDFDGVIVDSEPLHYKAFIKVLRPLGLNFSYETYLRRYVGFDDRDSFREILRDGGRNPKDFNLSELIEKKGNIFREIVEYELSAFPGALELVKLLAEKRLPLAIASGSYREEIKAMLSILKLIDYFPVIVAADDVTRSKPHPETYLKALKELRRNYPDHPLDPSQCLVIEDTPSGIEAARKAGLYILAVAHTHPIEQLRDADMAIPTLLDLNIDSITPPGM